MTLQRLQAIGIAMTCGGVAAYVVAFFYQGLLHGEGPGVFALLVGILGASGVLIVLHTTARLSMRLPVVAGVQYKPETVWLDTPEEIAGRERDRIADAIRANSHRFHDEEESIRDSFVVDDVVREVIVYIRGLE